MIEEALWAKIHELERRINTVNQDTHDRTIYARYTSNTASAMVNSDYTTINYEDKVTDTHNCVTVGAAWTFTCPASRVYTVTGGIRLASNTGWTVGDLAVMLVLKNGAELIILDHYTMGDNAGGAATIIGCYGSIQIHCNTYDTLKLSFYQNSGGNINLDEDATHNWCSISAYQ